MENIDALLAAWSQVGPKFMACRAMQRLGRGDITRAHYASFLKQTYFYTREDPQIQGYCTAYFRPEALGLVKPFFQHAISEIGHDQMALNDLKALGYCTDNIWREEPLPDTYSLFAYPYFSIQFRRAASYLGYLFFLEFLPTSRGAGIVQALEKVGVERSAMSFILEHTSVDIHHNKLMERYAAGLLRSKADLGAAITSMQVTAKLYANMVEGAFEAVDSCISGLVPMHGEAALA